MTIQSTDISKLYFQLHSCVTNLRDSTDEFRYVTVRELKRVDWSSHDYRIPSILVDMLNAPVYNTGEWYHMIRMFWDFRQLRDLIACPTVNNEVYFVQQNNVLGYNTSTKNVTNDTFYSDLYQGHSSDAWTCVCTDFNDYRMRLLGRRRTTSSTYGSSTE